MEPGTHGNKYLEMWRVRSRGWVWRRLKDGAVIRYADETNMLRNPVDEDTLTSLIPDLYFIVLQGSISIKIVVSGVGVHKPRECDDGVVREVLTNVF